MSPPFGECELTMGASPIWVLRPRVIAVKEPVGRVDSDHPRARRERSRATNEASACENLSRRAQSQHHREAAPTQYSRRFRYPEIKLSSRGILCLRQTEKGFNPISIFFKGF